MALLYSCSVQGSYHEVNQDASLLWQQSDLCVLAVADGLGSRPRSADGAQALCAAVREMAEHEAFLWDDMMATAARIHDGWLWQLRERQVVPRDAYTTCLVAVLRDQQVYVLRLGDGFVGLRADGVTHLSFDVKEERFFNETDCLTEAFQPACWSVATWPCATLDGLVLCTDGVDIFCEGCSQQESYARFTESFVAAYAGRSREVLATEVPVWLRDWRSADDRTIACLLREGCREENEKTEGRLGR